MFKYVVVHMIFKVYYKDLNVLKMIVLIIFTVLM